MLNQNCRDKGNECKEFNDALCIVKFWIAEKSELLVPVKDISVSIYKMKLPSEKTIASVIRLPQNSERDHDASKKF